MTFSLNVNTIFYGFSSDFEIQFKWASSTTQGATVNVVSQRHYVNLQQKKKRNFFFFFLCFWGENFKVRCWGTCREGKRRWVDGARPTSVRRASTGRRADGADDDGGARAAWGR